MDALTLTYYLKDGSVGPPKIYMGAEIKKYQVRSGKSHWSMSSTQYVKNVINTVEGLLKDEDRQLRKVKLAGKHPFQDGYLPELEQRNELIPELASSYLQFIGILRWEVELGRIDIFTEVALIHSTRSHQY